MHIKLHCIEFPSNGYHIMSWNNSLFRNDLKRVALLFNTRVPNPRPACHMRPSSPIRAALYSISRGSQSLTQEGPWVTILKGQKKTQINSQGNNHNFLMRHLMLFTITKRCNIMVNPDLNLYTVKSCYSVPWQVVTFDSTK
jgi:hypothetical protein